MLTIKHRSLPQMMGKLLIIMTAMTSLPVVSAPALTGSGDLPFPGDTGLPESVIPIFNDDSGVFTGIWDTTAASAWQGTFTGTLNFISTGNFTGINTLDFSGLKNGVLPINSFFGLGDLDEGSASGEIIKLTAYNSNGLITTPWLNEPTYQAGTGVQEASMLPDFDWDPQTGTYTFDGNGETWPGNPSTGVFMQNNQEILTLVIDDQTPFGGFGLRAPLPSSCDIPIDENECVATYNFDGTLNIPCVSVPDALGGSIIYEADMVLVPLSSPLTFELTNAQIK